MKSERVKENSNKCLQTWRNSDTIATDDNGMHKNDGLLYNVEPNTIIYYLKNFRTVLTEGKHRLPRFFSRVQNQLHWAIYGEIAAEVIYHRRIAKRNIRTI